MLFTLIFLTNIFACDDLIKKQLELLRHPRHDVKVIIVLTTYEDIVRTPYNGEVRELGEGLQSKKLWRESCQQVENSATLVLTSDRLDIYNGETIQSYQIRCDGNFILGEGKSGKVVATFQYEYHI